MLQPVDLLDPNVPARKAVPSARGEAGHASGEKSTATTVASGTDQVVPALFLSYKLDVGTETGDSSVARTDVAEATSRHGHYQIDAMKDPANANRLLQTRLALGYKTQSAFADEIGTHQHLYNTFERGRRRISLNVALRMSERFGIPLDWIYCGDATGLPTSLSISRPKRARRRWRATSVIQREGTPRRVRGPTGDVKYSQIANRLIQTRLALGYENQTVFAEQIGVQAYLYNPFERGKKRITLDVALRIRDSFGIRLEWIYRGKAAGLPGSLDKKLNRAR